LHADRVLTLDAQLQPELRYGEAWLRAIALARGLAPRIEKPGERAVLGVMTRNRTEWILVELAALVRGYVVVAMSPHDGDGGARHTVGRARPGCIVWERDAAERRAVFDVQPVVLDDDGAHGFARVPADGESTTIAQPPAPHSEDDLYTVLFTSGSTGTPKGAM